jgi:hypothetical protein
VNGAKKLTAPTFGRGLCSTVGVDHLLAAASAAGSHGLLQFVAGARFRAHGNDDLRAAQKAPVDAAGAT